MKVKLLKKLRRELKDKLQIHRNNSEFTLNWIYLSITLKGRIYKTERRYGNCNDSVYKVLLKRLERIVLRDYIAKRKCRTNCSVDTRRYEVDIDE